MFCLDLCTDKKNELVHCSHASVHLVATSQVFLWYIGFLGFYQLGKERKNRRLGDYECFFAALADQDKNVSGA